MLGTIHQKCVEQGFFPLNHRREKMSRDRRLDILLELVDLCYEIITDMKQQLSYYRVSVYKEEAADPLNKKIDQIRLVTGFFSDENVKEPIRDFDAIEKAAKLNFIPGECSYSVRVTRLIVDLEKQLSIFNRKIVSRDRTANLCNDFGSNLRRHRNELIHLCRYSGRHWSFMHEIE